MDKLRLGERIARARDAAGMTQESLGRAVRLDRTAITRLEKGERKLNVPELIAIAEVLQRPLAYFVAEPVPAVVSRRADAAAHDSTNALDIELEQFAADIRTLLEMKILRPVERDSRNRIPRDHVEAERLAEKTRQRLDLSTDPIVDLGATCERLGLFTYAAPFGTNGPDGACVEVDDGALGAAVINGQVQSGRRRMTLAHELGHWLCGDAYDKQASSDNERMINSFAIHFIAPRAGVTAVWNERNELSLRDRAIAVGASFRLSWSANLAHLTNLQLIDQETFASMSDRIPRKGEWLRLGLTRTDEPASPYLSPEFAAACVNGYASGRLTGDRTIELLRGTLTVDELPDIEPPTLDDARRSFRGHHGG